MKINKSNTMLPMFGSLKPGDVFSSHDMTFMVIAPLQPRVALNAINLQSGDLVEFDSGDDVKFYPNAELKLVP